MQFLNAFKKVAISLCNAFKLDSTLYTVISFAKMEYTEKWCFITLETTAINSLLTFTPNTWVFILCSRVIILPLISTWMKPIQPRHTQQHNSIFQVHKCEKHIHCLHSFEFVHIPLARPMQWLEASGITYICNWDVCSIWIHVMKSVIFQWVFRGCPLSPSLFGFYIDEVLHCIERFDRSGA